MPFSVTYANNILNYLFSKTKSLSPPALVYIGLSTNDPEADGGTFNELSGNNYARLLLSSKDSTYPNFFSTASNRNIKNDYQMVFNKATGDWETANGFGLFSSETGGTPFYYGKLDAPVFVPAQAVALFDPGTLSITLPDTDVSG